MNRLPVIVGFGGYNAAGRSSFHHAYRRTVLDSLTHDKQLSTLINLATLMGLVEHRDGVFVDKEGEQLTPEQVAQKYRSTIEDNTLIRKIHDAYFDVHNTPSNQQMSMNSQQPSSFTISRRDLPQPDS